MGYSRSRFNGLLLHGKLFKEFITALRCLSPG
jgi:hypothetical protein